MRSEHPATEAAPVKHGPRHAAPRTSVFTRYRLPVGKAAALASMPTAVLLGLTLAPQPAVADDNPAFPFAPGPCVTQSDEPAEEAKTETPAPEASSTPKPQESAAPAPEASPTPAPEESAAPEADTEPAPAETPTQETLAAPEASPSPSPEPTEARSLLDPLGIGETIGDLLDGPDEEPAPTTQEPTAPAPAPEEESPAPEAEPTAPEAGASTDAASEEGIREAAEQAGAEVEELSEDVKAPTAEPEAESATEPAADPETATGEDGKPRFPCPERDAEALAAAQLEEDVPLLPDQPWTLESSKLTLKGLKYHGIVEVKTYSGQVKKVLKFTASNGVDIKDLHQIVEGPEGHKTHIRTPAGTTSTLTEGTVTMYTESLKGNLFGLVPVTFSPESPPPLDVPLAIFTDATVKQAGQFGGTLRLHMLQTIE
ncbi:hypothetical protein ACFQLX_21935 [Streptomyces polyrhachis]|uniref:Hydrogenase expression protein HypF n=1 Tax=Streptomyces polyrhachis TaxID=1282885 RepID=A0ABW2GLG0_9ACTN